MQNPHKSRFLPVLAVIVGLSFFSLVLQMMLLSPSWATEPATQEETLNVDEIYQQAMNGDPAAQFLLFRMYRSGVGVEQDIDNAKRWLHSAGYSGHAEAQYWLGYIYFTGQGVERSVPQAMDWYEHAALQAYEPAEFMLGHIYNGMRYKFLERVPDKAVYWYNQAALHGNVQATLILGCKQYYGIDMSADEQSAVQWFSKASTMGEPDAYRFYQNHDEASLHELCDRLPRI